MSLETRVRALERLVGLDVVGLPSSSEAPAPTADDAVITRIETLERRILDNAIKDILWDTDTAKLLQELDPGAALTHQPVPVAAPFFYRQQHVLAVAQPLQATLQQLHDVQQLLLIAQDNSTELNTESAVMNAPILLPSNDLVSDERAQRLQRLQTSLQNLNVQVTLLVRRYDALLTYQQRFVRSFSEKLVLAQETIEAYEKQPGPES